MTDFIWENIFRAENKDQSIRKSLKANILFQDLNHKELALLEKIVNVRNYRPGENVFRQGEVGVGMYIILSGSVAVMVEEAVPVSDDRLSEIKTTPVTTLRTADFFGELALVENEGRRTATATIHEEAMLIGFFKPDLMELVQRNPSAGVKILLRLGEVLGRRLHLTTTKITQMKRQERPL